MRAEPRVISGTLARMGFRDTDAVSAQLTALGLPTEVPASDDPDGMAVLETLADAADPTLALATLTRIVETQEDAAELPDALRRHPGLRRRLLALLGASSALGEHLVTHPQDWRLLADDAVAATRPSAFGLRRILLGAVGADPDDPLPPGAGGASARDATPATEEALRLAFRRQQLLLAARDLSGPMLVDDVAAELADLASAALEAALAVAAAGLPAGSPPARLAVIAMGKAGGHELNYISDVDVVFVGSPTDLGGDEHEALRTCTRLAEGVIRICGQPGPGGVLFPVDAGLRPEGRFGPLVRTLASHRAYYERWARTWEFQALLKARPVAGDLELGRRYVQEIGPMVWTASTRDSFVPDVQAMRRRVEESLPPATAEREIKLGPGGLRDVEFAVQLLQMVHGRLDDRVRATATLPALRALREAGYIGRADGDALADAYRWLRMVEHRVQLQRLRRTHAIPAGGADLRWIARACGYVEENAFETDRRARRLVVRRLHEKLFYRPLLDAVARLPADTVQLSTDSAAQRLAALGFADAGRALEHLRALTRGVSRRAEIQRTLLPVLLDWFSGSADPDAALLAFRRVSDALGDTPWYLRLLRDDGLVAERLARLLSVSRYASELLVHSPATMRLLADDAGLAPRPRADLQVSLAAALDRARTWEDAVEAARGVRRAELFRIACADILGLLDVDAVGRALTDAAVVSVDAALRIAMTSVMLQRGEALPFRIAVIALGRLGGGETGYASDADVVFVHDGDPGADEHEVATLARTVAHETKRLLALPSPDPPLRIDAGLRPEGRQGPLTRSLAAYVSYHSKWASAWEAQALLRAAPLAGDVPLGEAFLRDVADVARYPQHFGADQVREVRRLKARMESERVSALQRDRNLKLGPGGLSDIEWTVQLLQLRHAHERPALQVTGTLPALRACVTENLLAPDDADILRRSWTNASRIRNAVTLVTGKPSDLVPAAASTELGGVARLLGYPPDAPAQLLEDQRGHARRARAVTDRLFYGEDPA